MVPAIPWYITAIVLATNLGIAVGVWRIVASAAARSGVSSRERRRVELGTALFLAGWLGAALLLAPAPGSLLGRDPFYLTPLIPLFAATGVAGTLVARRLSSGLRRVLDTASLPAVHGIQLYRIIGGIFIVLLAQGQLPAHFALPAGWGDVAIGLTAPLVALALRRGIRGAVPLAVTWSVVGLIDLAVAVGMGTGYLAPFLAPDLGARVPPAAAMGTFPLILVPTFAVPISVLLHLLGLARLTRGVRLGSPLVAKAAG
jgi:hypothetical protein